MLHAFLGTSYLSVFKVSQDLPDPLMDTVFKARMVKTAVKLYSKTESNSQRKHETKVDTKRDEHFDWLLKNEVKPLELVGNMSSQVNCRDSFEVYGLSIDISSNHRKEMFLDTRNV